jgi:hypothetical protein
MDPGLYVPFLPERMGIRVSLLLKPFEREKQRRPQHAGTMPRLAAMSFTKPKPQPAGDIDPSASFSLLITLR